jgi:hypothetical protein
MSEQAPPTSPLAIAEYRELRATIRQRGTARVVLAVITFVAWAALAGGTLIAHAHPVNCVIPLLILIAGFESVFALHVGVERIGRYLQVFYEQGSIQPPAWERLAMAFGQLPRGRAQSGIDPLFSVPFVLAVAVNCATGLSGGRPILAITVVVLHVIVLVRILRGGRFAARQREADLAAYSELKRQLQ